MADQSVSKYPKADAWYRRGITLICFVMCAIQVGNFILPPMKRKVGAGQHHGPFAKGLDVLAGVALVGALGDDGGGVAYSGTGSWTNGAKFGKARALFTVAIPNMTPFTLEGSG